MRRTTRETRVGSVTVGGGAPVSVQSMANVDPHDAKGIAEQANACAERGCAISLKFKEGPVQQDRTSITERSSDPLCGMWPSYICNVSDCSSLFYLCFPGRRLRVPVRSALTLCMRISPTQRST